jgi:hypothetical protein
MLRHQLRQIDRLHLAFQAGNLNRVLHVHQVKRVEPKDWTLPR